MKNIIDILNQLGKNLLSSDLREISSKAISDNEWFSTSQIKLAIEAICHEMLQKESLEGWLHQYETPVTKRDNVLIVMAGNIPLVGFFDLLCVIATGHTALVKPSHKDRVLTEWVINELRKIDNTIPIFIYDNQKVDRVIATGSDSARKYFEERYSGTPSLLRGTRHSIAVITENDSLDGLAEDIYSYSSLGCRNASMLFLPVGYDLTRIPSAETHPKYRSNYLQCRALMTMGGERFVDTGVSCLIESDKFPAQISTIAIRYYSDISEVTQWIEAHDSELQCIVAAETTLTHPRRVDFGRAQHPSLNDYADGIDTMKFLTTEI